MTSHKRNSYPVMVWMCKPQIHTQENNSGLVLGADAGNSYSFISINK